MGTLEYVLNLSASLIQVGGFFFTVAVGLYFWHSQRGGRSRLTKLAYLPEAGLQDVEDNPSPVSAVGWSRVPRVDRGPEPGWPRCLPTRRWLLPGVDLGEDLLGGQEGFPDERDAHVAGHVEEGLDQLVLGPALAERHAQVDGQFGIAAGGGVRHDADERPDVNRGRFQLSQIV